MSTLNKLLHVLNRVRSLFLLMCTLVLSAVFTLVKKDIYYPCPDNDVNSIDFFPLVCVEVYFDTHLYFIFEHTILIIFSLHIYFQSREFKTALLIFLLVNTVDLVDYFLIYGQAWFYMGGVPVSYNIVKVLIFGIAITNEILKELDR